MLAFPSLLLVTRYLGLIRIGAAIALGLALNAPRLVGQETFSSEQLAFFENKIRPVLVEHCYECHSEQASQADNLRGGLLLDSRQGLLTGGDSGPAVEPGKADESVLLSALRYDSYEMPPTGKLPDDVIADFAAWIDQGAADPREAAAPSATRQIDIEAGRNFWAFRPLAVPAAMDQRPANQHPIDYFIESKHRELGLRLSPPASPRVLIRRAWFDLLGLPPTPEEVAAWSQRLTVETTEAIPLNTNAWGELIDHLLARPEYGERWARHWMDIARFAESHGYEQDYDRPHAYHYRDFLIQAFNDDLPFDQFVQWQIAGDQLEPNNPQAWMATGFLGAGAFPTQLTEAEFESARYDELDDMVATSGVAFLGMSIGCARCHDHKFDPITTEDYYRFAATFTRTIRCEKEFDLNPAENLARREAFERELAVQRAHLSRWETEELPGEFRNWLTQAAAATALQSLWQTLPGELTSSAGSTYQPLADGSYLAVGAPPDREILTFEGRPAPGTWHCLRIEALADPSLPRGGPGRADNGNFALGNLQVEVIDAEGKAQAVSVATAAATHQQNESSLSVNASLDEDSISGWAVDGQIGRDQAAVFALTQPLLLNAQQRLRVQLTFQHPNGRHAMGRIRISVTSQSNVAPVVGAGGPPPEVWQALQRLTGYTPDELQAAGLQTSADWRLGLEWYKSMSAGWLEQSQKIAALEKAGPGVSLTKVLVSSEGLPHLPHHADDRGFPHFYPETHLLRRGDIHQKVSVVAPGYPQVLQRVGWETTDPSTRTRADSPSNPRAQLAAWLTDVESGPGVLVARVAVNRLWQHHFGRGIVATPNDFGEMGDRPTHPELLDWLAGELISGGWHLKPLHRAIMTSRTYLQGGKLPDDRRLAIDPENQYLWHRAPHRLEAEAIRDAMLSVAGELDPTMYGPGSLDPNMKRRSVYFFIKRSQLIPSMMLFDWPEHLVSIGRRQTTTVAPQALLFMNNGPGRAWAEAMARRVASTDDRQSVTATYQLAFGRDPTPSELKLAIEFLTADRNDRSAVDDADAGLQALADYCQMLLSTNEFVYID